MNECIIVLVYSAVVSIWSVGFWTSLASCVSGLGLRLLGFSNGGNKSFIAHYRLDILSFSFVVLIGVVIFLCSCFCSSLIRNPRACACKYRRVACSLSPSKLTFSSQSTIELVSIKSSSDAAFPCPKVMGHPLLEDAGNFTPRRCAGSLSSQSSTQQ
jgi:hypothetical protein